MPSSIGYAVLDDVSATVDPAVVVVRPAPRYV